MIVHAWPARARWALLVCVSVIAAAGCDCGGRTELLTNDDGGVADAGHSGTGADAGDAGSVGDGADAGDDGGTGTISDAGIPDAGPLPGVSIGDVTQAEGDTGGTTFTFTISLDRAPAAGFPVQVTWATADGTATSTPGSDYDPGAGTVTFAEGETSKTITVNVHGDTEIEPNETFTVTLSAPVNATLATASATGTIIADDFPTVGIADTSAPEGDVGPSAISFDVSLSADLPEGLDAQVSWSTLSSGGTASDGTDYTGASGTLTFHHGDPLTQTVSVQVNGDTEPEPSETFLVSLSSPVNTVLGNATAVGTIVNDDFPSATIADVTAIEGTGGTTPFRFTVTLDAPPQPGQDAQIAWSTAPGTATEGVDYAAASGTVTFTSDGPLTQTVTVDVIGDSAIEPDETFAVNLSSPVNVTLAHAQAVGTILTDDFPSVSIADASHVEGSGGGTTAFTFTVSLDALPAPGQDAQVSWTTSPGTADGSDFTDASGTLTFTSAGSLSQTITVNVAADTVQEPDETFTVILSSPVKLNLARATATGTIVNDDWPQASIDDVTHLEGTGGATTPFTFTVSLDQAPPAGKDVQIAWATAPGTATEGVDYTAASGTLTFTSAGPLTQTVTVNVLQDSTIEPDETFKVNLTNPVNVSLSKSTGTGTIQADDFPAVSIADVTAPEGDHGPKTFAFAVTLSQTPPAGYPAQVSFATSDGTAVEPSDYVSQTGTLTFQPGSAVTQTISVSVIGDTVDEPDETFNVTLGSPVNVGILRGTGVGTIQTDDYPVARISDAVVQEGNSGTTNAVLTVALSEQPFSGKDATLSWSTVDATAKHPSDFQASSGTLTFTRGGPLSQTISIPVNGDLTPESDEVFLVKLTSPVNAKLGDDVGMVRILDDEKPAVSIDDVSGLEGNSGTTTFTFHVTLSQAPAPGADVTLDWATSDRTALAGNDYVAGSGSLLFTSADPLTATVSVTVNGDTAKEAQEEFAVMLSNVHNAQLRRGVGVGIIEDDDGAILRVDPTSTGTEDGLTWATAYRTVQAAADRAQGLGGGQVWVASGTYASNSTVLTMRPLVSVLGGFQGYRSGTGIQEISADQRDPVGNETIFDGLGQAVHLVVGAANAVIDGFTIQNGGAMVGGNVSGLTTNLGGGLYNTAGTATVANCRFLRNAAAYRGGGVYTTTSMVIRDSTFVGNYAPQTAGGFYESNANSLVLRASFESNTSDLYDGGFSDISGSGSIVDSWFLNNSAQYGAGMESTWGTMTILRGHFFANTAAGWAGSGAAFYDDWGNAKLFQSEFVGNSAGASGGALYLRDSGTLLVDALVTDNTAQYGGGVYNWNYFGGTQHIVRGRIANNRATYGGGVYNNQTTAAFSGTVIEGNTASTSGGALYATTSATPSFTNCTIVGNFAPTGPAIVTGSSSSIALANTVLLDRSGITPAIATGSVVSSSNSSVSGTSPDPMLVNVPVHTVAATGGSTTSLGISRASTLFAVNDVVEVGDDGVPRSVAAVTTSTITVSPALSAAPASYTRVDNWGPAPSSLDVDLSLAPGSPCIDTGSNAQVTPDWGDLNANGNTTELTPLDAAGLPRIVNIVDVGAYERQAP